MSEQQPLLPVSGDSQTPPTCSKESLRTKLADFLESRTLHKIVIALITTDTICVLADLSYSFLTPGCNPPGPESPQWLEVLSYISLSITTIFLLEIPLSLWAFGLQYINPFGPVTHAGLHLFDATIILTTFVLEIVLRGRERELAGLLIVLRLWRLVKLIGGVTVGAGELGEENAHEIAELKLELERAKAEISNIKEENAALRQRMYQLSEATRTGWEDDI